MFICIFQTAYDLNNRRFFDVFKYGGVNITAFKIIQDKSDAYKKAEQLWKSKQSNYPDLFPLSVSSGKLTFVSVAPVLVHIFHHDSPLCLIAGSADCEGLL